MTTFVIVHGATAGGWFMRPIADPLREAGHTVYTPTLTGLGERSHLLSGDIDLETHILDVMKVLDYEDLTNVVLVGKSYSGMVVTAVADRMPERVGHLVYLDAAVPQDGQCLLDLGNADVIPMLTEIVQAHGDGWLLPANPTVDPRLTPHPMKTATQEIRLTGSAPAARIPRTYIFCTGKPSDHIATEFTRKGAVRAQTQGWGYHEINTGHDPELEDPGAVVEILIGLA